MATEFGEVVSQWYDRLHSPFASFMAARYPALSPDDIDDIYAETFMSVYDNLQRGTVAPDTQWKSYIWRIGINQALNRLKASGRMVRPDTGGIDDGDDEPTASSFEKLVPLDELVQESGLAPDDRERMLQVMNGIMHAMPEPCRTLLPDFYYAGMSLEEIRQEIGYATTDAVKSQRYKCFQRLQAAVRSKLQAMGLSIF